MRRLLVSALGLGVAADALLHVGSWRVGFALWMLAALALLAVFAPSVDATQRTERLALLGAAALLALLLVLRDAPMLYALDMIALVVTLLLIAWRAGPRPLAALEPRDALIGGLAGVSALALGAPTAISSAVPAGRVALPSRRTALLTALGTLGAVPVLIVTTALLAEGDAAFASFLTRFEGALDGAVGHLAFAAAATWVSAGVLIGAGERLGVRDAVLRRELRAPFASVVPLLGGLAALLGIWVELQLRVLFGGARYLAETVGVSAADYARSGFFQLVAVAGLVLASLLLADDLIDRAPGRDRRRFASLGGVLVALVGIVLVSAFRRLTLYVDAFGLTEDRVLALAILVWVALVLSWFAASVLAGRRGRFAPGVLVLSAVWLATLNVANPEAWIVRVNVARSVAGAPFDAAYHATLSADAVPALLAAEGRLPAADAAALRAALTGTWRERAAERADWRRWSLPYRVAVARVPR